MSTDVVVPTFTHALVSSEPWPWQVTGDRLEVTAKPHSDLFADPGGDVQTAAESQMNAVTLLGPAPAGDFTLQAYVEVDFADTFDAGVLMVWLDDRHWAKLCFEYSPAGVPMVVSVVTRDVSDDANAFDVTASGVHLRVSRVGRVFAFHASTDGTTWAMVRAFALPGEGDVRIGFEAQSPMGDGCRVAFSGVELVERTLGDLRDGS